jgi:hypothetical protein
LAILFFFKVKMSTPADQLMAMHVALNNTPELRAELFRHAKAAVSTHGLIVYLCNKSLQPVADSILVHKTFAPVGGFVFAGIPIRLLGPMMVKMRKILLSLPRGKLPILFTNTGGQNPGLVTISEAGGRVSSMIMHLHPAHKDDVVLVDWCVGVESATDAQYQRYTVCSNCHNKGAGVKLCSGCRGVYYCNAACQNANWAEHKAECAPLGVLCSPTLDWFDFTMQT